MPLLAAACSELPGSQRQIRRGFCRSFALRVFVRPVCFFCPPFFCMVLSIKSITPSLEMLEPCQSVPTRKYAKCGVLFRTSANHKAARARSFDPVILHREQCGLQGLRSQSDAEGGRGCWPCIEPCSIMATCRRGDLCLFRRFFRVVSVRSLGKSKIYLILPIFYHAVGMIRTSSCSYSVFTASSGFFWRWWCGWCCVACGVQCRLRIDRYDGKPYYCCVPLFL